MQSYYQPGELAIEIQKRVNEILDFMNVEPNQNRQMPIIAYAPQKDNPGRNGGLELAVDLR